MVLSTNYIASIENKIIEWKLKEDRRQATFENNERARQATAQIKIADVERKVVEWQSKENIRQGTFETNEQSREIVTDTKIGELESRFQTLTTQQQQDAGLIDAMKGEPSMRAKIDKMDALTDKISTIKDTKGDTDFKWSLEHEDGKLYLKYGEE